MAKEYIHHRKDMEDFGFIDMMLKEGHATTIDEKLIPYEGRMLIVLQKYYSYGSYFVVVPGFVLNSRTDEHKTLISEVEPVNKSRQADITKLLQKMDFRGNVDFWGMEEER